jgi:hypothetical protein
MNQTVKTLSDLGERLGASPNPTSWDMWKTSEYQASVLEAINDLEAFAKHMETNLTHHSMACILNDEEGLCSDEHGNPIITIDSCKCLDKSARVLLGKYSKSQKALKQ